MNRRPMILCQAMVVGLVMLGTRLAAQESADSLRQRCDRLVAVVEAGRRDSPGAYAAAYQCGERGANAVARSWSLWKQVTDRDALVRFATTTRFLRDAVVFDALLEVAADESSNPIARALALRNLRLMRKPGSDLDLENLEALARAFTQPDGIRDADTSTLCGYGLLTSDVPSIEVRPLSPGQHQRLATLRTNLMDSPAVPPLVRAAALCG